MRIKPFTIEDKKKGDKMAVIVTVQHSNGTSEVRGSSDYTIAGTMSEAIAILDRLQKDGTIIEKK